MSIGIFSNSGNDVKLLKDQLDLNGTAKVLTGTSDPRSSAKDAPQGSLYLQTGATGGKLFKKLDAGSSTNWTEVGSGAGGINYILNPDAEAGTTGWATYADAAATTPVDGTGGSPTVTFTTSASSPLRGNNSFLITKDAANRQGEGASYAFSIDSADKASVIAVEFDYAIASGTFAAGDSSDIRVFVYDVTNSVLITPAPYTIQSNTQNKFKGVFQSASNSTSYRLILHCATTSASAHTFKIDNVRVGPQTIVFGAPIGDWVTSTVTPSAGFGTVTNSFYRQRRVGDSVHVRGSFRSGTTAGSVAYFDMPTGLVIDSTKLTAQVSAQGVGTANLVVAAGGGTEVYSTNAGLVLFYDGSDTSKVFISTQTESNVFDKEFVSAFVTSTDNMTFDFVVPVAGWSSNLEISNDAETRVVAARASGAVSSTTSGNIIVFPTLDFDTHAAYSTSTGRYTVPVSGYIKVSTFFIFANSAILYEVWVNGVSVKTIGQSDTDNGSTTAAVLIRVNAGDLVDIRPAATTGAIDSKSWVSFERVSGPSAIAANELVAAHYVPAGVTSLVNATDTIINYATKVIDTHSAVTTGASWKFTAPVAGTYQVSASSNSVAAGGGERYISVSKNGSLYARGSWAPGSAGSTQGQTVCALVSMVPGDYVDIRMFQSSGGAINTDATLLTYVSIYRVGF